jgi:hypothetical protein
MSDDNDVDAIDYEALERAIALTLAEDDQGRVEQVQSMLEDRNRLEVGQFCAYHRQADSLRIKPWESTPSWIDPDEVDAILRRGPDHREYGAARLLKLMLSFGLSPYDPEPLQSIERAKQRHKLAKV